MARSARMLVALVIMRVVRILANVLTPTSACQWNAQSINETVDGPLGAWRLSASIALLEFGRRVFVWAYPAR